MVSEFVGKYRFLSNFYPAPVTFEGRLYTTVEHAFQASKSTDEGVREMIANVRYPSDAKTLGRRVDLRPNWPEIKLGIMLQLLREKFSDPVFKAVLLSTGDEELVEGNWWNDRFWGVCRGEGENHLGKLLMQIRDELRA
jgi:ribA/ribD-fused uncharacterized protein